MSVPSVGVSAGFRALPTLAAAFGIVARHAIVLLVQIFLILAAVLGIGALIGVGVGLGSSAEDLGRNTNLAIAIMGAIGLAIWLFASVNIWIGFGRVAMRGEPPRILSLFSWGRRQWRMLGIAVLCIACAFGPAVVLAMITVKVGRGDSSVQGTLVGISTLASAIWFVLVLARLALALPIVADDGPPHALRTSWALTHGCAARLAGGILLISFLMLVTELGVILPAVSVLHLDPGGIYVGAIQTVVGGFGGAMSMVFCALAYLKLRGPAPA